MLVTFLLSVASILLGVLFGIITGLTPGVHVNTISMLVFSLGLNTLITEKSLLALFITSMAVTHTFLDTIPSTFLGAPDTGTALGVLPGHRYLLKGFGLQAVKLSIIGSVSGLLLSITLYYWFKTFTSVLYNVLKTKIWLLLSLISVFIILKPDKKFETFIVYALSGVLGLIVLNSYVNNPLQPLLSGLFGASTLVYSLKSNTKIPEQKIFKFTRFNTKKLLKALAGAQFSGFLTAILPGIGASQAAVIAMIVTGNIGDQGFMAMIGSITTVNFVLSIAALHALNKARNGAIIAVQRILVGKPNIALLLAAILISGCLASVIALKISVLFAKHFTKVSYPKLCIAVLLLLTIIEVAQGVTHVAIFLTSTAIGLLAATWKVPRTSAMACLLLPIITWNFS